MFQLNLSGVLDVAQAAITTAAPPPPSTRYPAMLPSAGTRKPPSMGARPLRRTCGYGYKAGPGGVCMSQGCFDGRSPCVVADIYGRTCSYDQLLAFQASYGQAACGPAPELPPLPPPPPTPPPAPSSPAIEIDFDASAPSSGVAPGVKVVTRDPYIPKGRSRVPKWALTVGGLAVAGAIAGIIVTLLTRK